MRKLLFMLPLFLAACALPVTKVEQTGVDNSGGVIVLDQRPDQEKRTETLSTIIGTNGYGIGRYGDETLSPPMAQLLRRGAYEKLGAKNSDMKITIYHMVVYFNAKTALTSAAVFGAAGVLAESARQKSFNTHAGVGELVSNRDVFEASAVEAEYKLAAYTAQENPSSGAVYVIYVDADINGKRVFIRTVSSIEHPPATSPYAGMTPYAVAASSTVDYFLAQYLSPEN